MNQPRGSRPPICQRYPVAFSCSKSLQTPSLPIAIKPLPFDYITKKQHPSRRLNFLEGWANSSPSRFGDRQLLDEQKLLGVHQGPKDVFVSQFLVGRMLGDVRQSRGFLILVGLVTKCPQEKVIHLLIIGALVLGG